MALIIETGDVTRPKAEIYLIDFRKGQVDFRWLEADGTPSKVYSGDCVVYADVSAASNMTEVETLVSDAVIGAANAADVE